MINPKQNIIYKLDKKCENLENIYIPENVTIFDAQDCINFYDLKGLNNHSHLEVLLLRNTNINGADLTYIPASVKAVDLRDCKNIQSFVKLPNRVENPLRILVSFSGERLLNSIPENVSVEIEGNFAPIHRMKKHPSFFNSFFQKIRN